MKKVITICLLLLVAIACKPGQAIEPAALLDKTWVRQSGTYLGAVSPYKNLIIEFRRDGVLLYDADKNIAGCCAPYSFRSTASTLQFRYDNPKPDPVCARINCSISELTAGVDWQIETLTDTELIISTDKQRIVYKVQ